VELLKVPGLSIPILRGRYCLRHYIPKNCNPFRIVNANFFPYVLVKFDFDDVSVLLCPTIFMRR
jgi:hypothetical protein